MGREFYRKTRSLLDELGSTLLLIGEAAASQSGDVTIACVHSAAYHYLPEFISRYRSQFPLVRVQIQDDSAGDVLDSVTRGEADFGINFVGRQESDIESIPCCASASSWPVIGTISWQPSAA